ncbi:MAG: prolipoprotein diacylglyceryl transferase [Bacteroidetes bacterium]|nr:prolipoprotein diacylglyceryl transferase [Bacteroidota bacterium]
MLNFITWNPDPEIFQIGSFAIRWYGLLFASAFIVGYFIMQRIFKHENLPANLLDKLTTYAIIATIIGARLGHCLFYDLEYYMSHPLEIILIWKGGLASHGAAIGLLLALYLFAKKYKKPYIWILDRITIAVALAGCFIRLGNLMNSEIFGKPTTLPWGFIYTRYDNIPRHPTQIYEALSYFLIFIFLYVYYWKKKGNPKPGFMFGIFLILVFTLRFLIEFLKEPQVAFETDMVLNMGQLLSIPFIILGLIIILWPQRKKHLFIKFQLLV